MTYCKRFDNRSYRNVCNISFLKLSHNFRITNDQNISSGEKTRKLDTLAKLFQAVRSRPVS